MRLITARGSTLQTGEFIRRDEPPKQSQKWLLMVIDLLNYRFNILAICALIFASAQLSIAATPSGSIIRNQAEATYFDPAADRSFNVTSTIATVRVSSAPNFVLDTDNETLASPNETIAFPHVLTNTGNESDSYGLRFSDVDTADELLDLAVHIDRNENGALDAGEPAISVTDTLDPGQSVSLLLCGRVPPLAVSGQDFASNIEAVSMIDPENIQTRRDTARVDFDLPFEITKSSNPPCATPLLPGGLINYTIDMVNLEDLKPSVVEYDIDGVIQMGLYIEDIIPANTTLVAGTATRSAPDQGILVVRKANSSSTSLSKFANYRESDLVMSAGLFVPETEMRKGQSGRFFFQVRVNRNMTPGTVVNNRIFVDLDADGLSDVSSNETCNSIAPGGEGLNAQLRFLEPSENVRGLISRSFGQSKTEGNGEGSPLLLEPRHKIDTDFVDALVYRLDKTPGYVQSRDGVYIEARSNALNTLGFEQEDAYEASFIRVRVQSKKTSDTLMIRLLETGPNTGLFRAETAFRLSDIDSGRGRDCGPAIQEQCVLRSQTGDELQATIFDPGVQATLQDFAVVDPLGMVFDSTSLEPVAGATVYLRNADNSPAVNPDTGRELASQVTGENGEYFIPRLKSGMYQVFVDPPLNFTFPSIVDPDVFAGRRMVDNRSYGEAGFAKVAKSGLFNSGFSETPPVLDIPIDPDLKQGQLSLEKSADTNAVSFGDTLTYTLETRNGTNAILLDVKIVDMPPAGFRYVEGSARLNGSELNIERAQTTRGLSFPIGRLEIAETARITYQLQVGPEVRPGRAVNVAVSTGRTGGFVQAQSENARESVKVLNEGLLSGRAYIIGSVWGDINENGTRDDGEIGLPGVRIWFEDGTWAETDELGRYSLYGLEPKLKVARLDRQTLPSMVTPIRTDSRSTGRGYSRFVDLIAGDMHRVDFPLRCEEECSLGSKFGTLVTERAAQQSPNAMLDQALAFEGLIGETVSRDLATQREQAGPDGDISSGRLNTIGTSANDFGAAAAELLPENQNQAVPGEEKQTLDPEQLAINLSNTDIDTGSWAWPAPSAETSETYSRDGRFIAFVKAGLRPTLYVDDIAVDESRLGALVENREKAMTVAAWYGVDMEAGTHRVEVRGEDMFGNIRVLAGLDVIRPGAAEALKIEAPSVKVSADGRSKAVLKLRALDTNQAPASGTQFITLTAERPGGKHPLTFEGRDVQPDEPGFQVRLRDGMAKVELRSPEKAGDVKVTATNGGGLSAQQSVTFKAPLRDMIAVGVVEVGGDIYDLKGQLDPANADEYPADMNVDGRGAVFLKGRVKGDALLTFAYDSEKKREDGLFRDIDPEAYYPVYGDGSEKGFEAQSRSKIYVRVEKNDSSIMWGDYRSDAFGEDSLIRKRRSLTGANAVFKYRKATVQLFGAEAKNLLRTERIRGRGTALDMILPGGPLVTNSEVLMIEVRAKDNPGLIISERNLTRFADYLLDDETGRLTLNEPIASIDSEGNPIFLVAVYETESRSKVGVVAGARASLETKNGRVWAGANFDESDPTSKRKMAASVGVEQTLKNTYIWAEAGHMQTDMAGGNSVKGEAYRAGLETPLLEGQLKVEFAQADKEFDNPDAPIFAGRREARGEYRKGLSQDVEFIASATYSQDMESSDNRMTSEALVKANFNKWVLSAGPRFIKEDTQNQVSEYASVLLRVERPAELFGLGANLNFEIEQAIDDPRTRVQVGGDVLLREDTRLYANHRILDEFPEQTFAQGLLQSQNDLGQSKTVVGLETKILPNTDAFGEWRMGGALDSQTGEAAYGIRAQWDVLDGLSIAPQIEIVDTFNTGTDPNSSVLDSKAISVAIADRRMQDSRRTLRVEGRKTDASTYIGLRTAWAQRFTPELTGALKFDLAHDDIAGAENNDRRRLTLGLARRPAQSGKTDLFALYQFLKDKQALDIRDVHIVSGHANREFGDHWTVSARAVSKWESANGFNSSAQIFGGRVIRDLGARWDVQIRASQKIINWNDSSQLSLGAAASWQPKENLRVTLGYNFIGFRDQDLDPKGYDAQGIYWNLALAIDESWFGWLTPN